MNIALELKDRSIKLFYGSIYDNCLKMLIAL